MANPDNGSRDSSDTGDRREPPRTAAQFDEKLMDLARNVGQTGGTDDVADGIPTRYAATVICCREGRQRGEAGTAEPEVLMARRDTALAFAGGMWVFPGGRIDGTDMEGADMAGADTESMAKADPALLDETALDRAERSAAVREAREEVDIELETGELIRYSHWTPPALTKKRYLTSFFLAPLWDERAQRDITVDDSEIRDHRWLPISGVLSSHSPGHFDLAPPTFITLCNLSGHRSLDALVSTVEAATPERFATRFCSIDGIGVALYHGDCAYELSDGPGGSEHDLEALEGPRHRLWMSPDGWRYERTL